MKRDLFITTNSELSIKNSILVLKNESTKKVPLHLIDNIFLFGESELKYQTIKELSNNKINLYFLSYSGRLKGILMSENLTSNYKNRLIQYDLYTNKRVEVANKIVIEKCKSIENLLKIDLSKEREKIKNSISLDSTLGYEGSISKYLFSDVRAKLKNISIEFQAREYRPSKDFVNSLLSFVYTLYYLAIYPIIISSGFDPYLGFLHEKRGTHLAFLSDIMEINRAKLTLFAIDLIIENKLSADDFDDRYRLKQEKLKLVIFEFVVNFIENQNELNITKNFAKELVDAGCYAK